VSVDLPLVARTWELGPDAPLIDLLPATGGAAWIRHDDGLVGWGAAARFEVPPGPDRFDAVEAAWQDAAGRADLAAPRDLVAVGSFTFDERSHGSSFVVPEVVVRREGRRTSLTAVARDREPERPDVVVKAATADPAADRPRYAGSSMPDVHWLEAVAVAVARVRAGALDKVVLARDHAVWSKAPFDARVLARRLHARFPGCFTFSVDGLVGATPELLVSRTGTRVESLPLAGTTGRSDDPDRDRELGEALRASAKDRWEHELLVRGVATVLDPLCTHLARSEEPFLLPLDNVQHLATRFVGELRDPVGSLTLAGALHPTPAVGGTPTDEALETIRELEGMDRGRYAGPVGWTDATGDGEWGVALRCAELSGARARLFAGAGIVGDSLPEDELEETRLKLLAMQSAFRP
jgi:menaquinone-specific isochorismate synthase